MNCECRSDVERYLGVVTARGVGEMVREKDVLRTLAKLLPKWVPFGAEGEAEEREKLVLRVNFGSASAMGGTMVIGKGVTVMPGSVEEKRGGLL